MEKPFLTIILTIVLSISLCTCSNSQTKENRATKSAYGNVQKDTLIHAKSDSLTSKDTTNIVLEDSTPISFTIKKIDTFKTENENNFFDLSTEKQAVFGEPAFHYFYKGHTIYFLLNDQIFRLKTITKNSDTGIIDILKSNEWKHNLSTEIGNRGFLWDDVNLDGYNDFTSYGRYYKVTYLYNPKTKRLNTTSIKMDVATYVLDSAKKIFYSIAFTKDISYSSVLFQIQADTIHNYYQLECFKEENDPEKVRDLRLYKCIKNETLFNLPILGKNIQDSYIKKFTWGKDFGTNEYNKAYERDPIPFWRKNYKQLLKDY